MGRVQDSGKMETVAGDWLQCSGLFLTSPSGILVTHGFSAGWKSLVFKQTWLVGIALAGKWDQGRLRTALLKREILLGRSGASSQLREREIISQSWSMQFRKLFEHSVLLAKFPVAGVADNVWHQ